MTDHPAPITDEDLSAHLDGQAAPDVAGRIAADPDAQARLDGLRAAARAVGGAPVPALPAATVDQLVGRALQAFDEQTEAAGKPVADAPRDLVPPAARRRLPPTWLVAAAVVLVVALGIGLVVTGRDRGQNDQAANLATTESTSRDQNTASKSGENPSSDAAAPGRSEHGAASGAAPSTTIGQAFAAGAVDLGAFDSADALRTSLAPRFPDAPATASSAGRPATTAVQRCGTQVMVTLNLKSDPLHVGYATVAGQQVLVYEFASTSFTDQSPTTLVAAVGIRACDPVVTFQR